MLKKRYNSINEALKNRFGCKVFKVSLESGCVCPNRDGRSGTNGCIFCSQEAYLTAATGELRKDKSIKETLEDGIAYVTRRHRAAKFIAYFQSGTNTYAPAERLRPLFEEAISSTKVVGLAVSTRPDCLDENHIDLFEELSGRTMLWVELGLQSAHDDTLRLICRGHTVSDFTSASARLKQRGISVVAHVILGLPGESEQQMIETAHYLNEQRVSGVKIHNIHVLKGTALEKLYASGELEVPDLPTYAGWVCDFLEHLDPRILIHRVNGHAPRHLTIAPAWSVNKLAVFNAVEMEMARRDSWQGKKLS